MKGIWLENQKIELKLNIPQPEIQQGETLIKVLRGGICHTEFSGCFVSKLLCESRQVQNICKSLSNIHQGRANSLSPLQIKCRNYA